MSETRDIAIEALTSIKHYMVVSDKRHEELSGQQDKIIKSLQTLMHDMGDIKIQAAEMRGAGKMAKALWVAGTGAIGFLGGVTSHVIR